MRHAPRAVLVVLCTLAACAEPARDRYRDLELAPPLGTSGASYGDYAAPAAAPARRAPRPQPVAPAPVPYIAPAPALVPPPQPVTRVLVPAGATLFVTTTEPLCASTHAAGARFSAAITEPSGGLRGTVTFEVTDAGTASGYGSARLNATPTMISLGGTPFDLGAELLEFPVERIRSSGSGGGDMKRALIGGALGAAAGQLIGHNRRSTTTGAAIGAALGGGASVATAERDACVPVGSRIVLRVRHDVVTTN